MPTIYRAGGLRFIIFVDDHPPPHVHVEGQDGRAKIALDGPRVVWVRGMSRTDRNVAFDVVKAQQASFLRSWKTIHG